MAVYETLEYMCCYGEEKAEYKKQLRLAQQRTAQERQNSEDVASCSHTDSEGQGESTRLLDAEEIPLEMLPSTLGQQTSNSHPDSYPHAGHVTNLSQSDTFLESQPLLTSSNATAIVSEMPQEFTECNSVPLELLQSLSSNEVQMNVDLSNGHYIQDVKK